jgi:hypothetical protein
LTTALTIRLKAAKSIASDMPRVNEDVSLDAADRGTRLPGISAYFSTRGDGGANRMIRTLGAH